MASFEDSHCRLSRRQCWRQILRGIGLDLLLAVRLDLEVRRKHLGVHMKVRANTG